MPAESFNSKKIWIDIDNTPHVPFFVPIVDELKKYGFPVLVTARDAYQVTELARFFKMPCRIVGRHYGKNKALKVIGTFIRAAQLATAVASSKPALAISHGSRSQVFASSALGIPSVMISDYEFGKPPVFVEPTYVMIPEVMPGTAMPFHNARVYRYPGIKEDVYVPRFCPNPVIRTYLGLRDESVIVTIRPPADEAHYHRPETDVLFHAVMDFLGQRSDVQMVLLPRNSRQEEALRKLWPNLLSLGKAVIPDHVVNGLNLLWFSDLAISGGGTMNREAAALGMPVYSIFRGKIGAVDQYLAKEGRLVLLEKAEDVYERIILSKRSRRRIPDYSHPMTLTTIVDNLLAMIESANSHQRKVA